MIKSHEIRLLPTKSQEMFFIKSCGVARFAYNWALSKWQDDYKIGVNQSAYKLVKYLNSIKRKEFEWMQETGKTCSQYAIHNLESAFVNMWKNNGSYPRFKKKGVNDRFVSSESSHQFKQVDKKIWVPKLGWVKCCENLRFDGKVNNVVIKRKANYWFAVVTITIDDSSHINKNKSDSQAVVGIDMGINSMMFLSDGSKYENPKALKNNLKQLKRIQRRLSRKKIGGSNYNKQKIKLSRKHYRISCIRKNAIHNATSDIISRYENIVIETLSSSNLIKNKNLAQSISDVSFYEIKRQLIYKSNWNNRTLIKADRWFASSKICSECGHKSNTLKLSNRIYECNNCGMVMNRDLNAAKNLAKYQPYLQVEGSNASGFGSSALLKHSPKMNEEIGLFINTKNL